MRATREPRGSRSNSRTWSSWSPWIGSVVTSRSRAFQRVPFELSQGSRLAGSSAGHNRKASFDRFEPFSARPSLRELLDATPRDREQDAGRILVALGETGVTASDRRG